MASKHTKNINNAKSYANKERSAVRRIDYAVDDQAWIKGLLTRAAFGVLGSVHEDQPFLTPLLFVYVEEHHAIYYHGAQAGRMRANAALNPKAVFNAAEMGRILPAPLAVDFSVEYNSVTVFGATARLEDPQEAAAALQRLMDKYAPHLEPGQDYTPTRPEDLKRTAVYKLSIEAWSGKQIQAPADSPGAYTFDSVFNPAGRDGR